MKARTLQCEATQAHDEQRGRAAGRAVLSPGKATIFVLLAALVALLVAQPALAHRKGKAEPKIAAAVSEAGGLRPVLTVRLTDADSKKPLKGATVTALAEMRDIEGMQTRRIRLSEVRPALYRARLTFPHEGAWRVRVSVSGKKVVKASGTLAVAIREAAQAKPRKAGGGGLQMPHGGSAAHVVPLGTTIEEDHLTGGDYARMANLWIHSVAALGWILGVLAMVLALSAHVGVIAEGARRRIAEAYGSWGAWIHWSFVPVIVATGVYNMLYVTPFPLAYRPSQIDELREIPYGPLYEAILVAKLALFGVLLMTGTIMLLRVVRNPLPAPLPSNPHPPGVVKTLVAALGPAGIVYLAAIPLIIGAAMALRYVHVLNHVAEVLRAG